MTEHPSPASAPGADLRLPAEGAVKVVVWDLDGTVWDDVAVELPEGRAPRPRADVLAAVRRLAEAGVVSSVASRTDPALARLLGDPPSAPLAELAAQVVAPQLGWHDKSAMLARIAATLGVGEGSLLLVDDSGFERAEVAARLPAAGTTDRAGLLADLDAAESRVLPAAVSPESAGRTRRYQEQARRDEAAARHPDRESFLVACDLRMLVRHAGPGDAARVVELIARAHRLASSRIELDDAALRGWLGAPDRTVVIAQLADRFGDHGTIGAALLRRADDALVVDGLAVSCRVAGRGVPTAFAAALLAHARGALHLPIRVTTANVELRMLVRAIGGTLVPVADDEVLGVLDGGHDDSSGGHGDGRVGGPEWISVDDRIGRLP